MRISTVGYVGKQGVKNIWRNKMFSLASIATMSACIFLFGLFFSIIVNFQYIIRTAEEGVAITVFFEEDATDAQKRNIGEQLENHEGVSNVRYVSADERGRSSRNSISETTRSWRKDLKTTIHWPAQITMKYICRQQRTVRACLREADRCPRLRKNL